MAPPFAYLKRGFKYSKPPSIFEGGSNIWDPAATKPARRILPKTRGIPAETWSEVPPPPLGALFLLSSSAGAANTSSLFSNIWSGASNIRPPVTYLKGASHICSPLHKIEGGFTHLKHSSTIWKGWVGGGLQILDPPFKYVKGTPIIWSMAATKLARRIFPRNLKEPGPNHDQHWWVVQPIRPPPPAIPHWLCRRRGGLETSNMCAPFPLKYVKGASNIEGPPFTHLTGGFQYVKPSNCWRGAAQIWSPLPVFESGSNYLKPPPHIRRELHIFEGSFTYLKPHFKDLKGDCNSLKPLLIFDVALQLFEAHFKYVTGGFTYLKPLSNMVLVHELFE